MADISKGEQAEPTYGYAVATTPLTNLSGGEPSHVINVQINGETASSVVVTTSNVNAPQVHVYATAQPGTTTARSAVTIQRGQWSAGLCGCFDFCVPNCCMAWCCPCISAAQIGVRVGYNYSTVLVCYAALVIADLIFYSMGAADISASGESYYSDSYSYYSFDTEYKMTTWGYLGGVVSIVLFMAYWQLRSKVRSTFDLPGSCLGDCCATFWCSCCALAQMATHVKSYKPGSCDFGPPDELAAYNE